MVGWIPRYFEQKDVPPSFLRDLWPRDKSISALLSTGNERPGDLFLDLPHSPDEDDKARASKDSDVTTRAANSEGDRAGAAHAVYR